MVLEVRQPLKSAGYDEIRRDQQPVSRRSSLFGPQTDSNRPFFRAPLCHIGGRKRFPRNR
jgi:hypothetical protein